ncbi:30S ribosomal protein S15 [Candidatus Bathyarchaeota archaeon]|nr:MAG: 30S ribosomal protein S15 [Candidatus Bathyarchaeota archaeon]TMI67511.1 MAG: 30S ribosomal protein S15 [Candidatus Bathyarchaeota archaeon]
MARLYSPKKGSSGSTRPVSRRPPAWFKYQPEEVESLILKLVKEGNSPSLVGQILRDRHGVPLASQALGRRLETVLTPELRTKIPDDLDILVRRADNMRRHLERNKKDYPNKRALALVESKIHRLVKFYHGSGRLPNDWEYKPVAASIR